MPTAYITVPSDEASDIAARLVQERLAACVNRIPITSTYRWEGDVVTDDEVLLLAKTTDARYDELVDHVEALHPYDVPCIERFDEAAVADAFDEWLHESVS